MRSPLSPNIANIFMENFEKDQQRTKKPQIVFE